MADLLETTRARLAVGAQEYGDASYERSRSELIDEVRQELADVIGWLAIAWAAERKVRMPDSFDAFIEASRHPESELEYLCATIVAHAERANEALL